MLTHSVKAAVNWLISLLRTHSRIGRNPHIVNSITSMNDVHFSKTQLFWGHNLSLAISISGLHILGSWTPSGAGWDGAGSSDTKEEQKQVTFADHLPHARDHAAEHLSHLNSFNRHSQPMRWWYLPVSWGRCGGTDINSPKIPELAGGGAGLSTTWRQVGSRGTLLLTQNNLSEHMLAAFIDLLRNYVLLYWYVHCYTSDIKKSLKGRERQITCQPILPHISLSCTPHSEGHGPAQCK